MKINKKKYDNYDNNFEFRILNNIDYDYFDKLTKEEANHLYFTRMFINFMLEKLNINLEDINTYLMFDCDEMFGPYFEQANEEFNNNFKKIISLYIYKKFIYNDKDYKNEIIRIFNINKKNILECIAKDKIDNFSCINIDMYNNTSKLTKYLYNIENTLIFENIDLHVNYYYKISTILEDLYLLYNTIDKIFNIFFEENNVCISYLLYDIEGVNIKVGDKYIEEDNIIDKNTLKSKLETENNNSKSQSSSDDKDVTSKDKPSIGKKDDDDEICNKCNKLTRKCILYKKR